MPEFVGAWPSTGTGWRSISSSTASATTSIEQLRGEPLLEVKLRAPRGAWAARDPHDTGRRRCSRASTNRNGRDRAIRPGAALDHRHQLSAGDLLGRFVLPEQLEQRITFPDVVAAHRSSNRAVSERRFHALAVRASELPHAGYAYRSRMAQSAAEVHRRRKPPTSWPTASPSPGRGPGN